MAHKLKSDEMACPECASAVGMAAKVCRYCGYRFTSQDYTTAKAVHSRAGKTTAFGCIGLILILAIAAGIGRRDDKIPAPAAVAEPLKPAAIAPDAVYPMGKAQFPKMFARLGVAGFDRANQKAHLAAMKVAGMSTTPRCDRVYSVIVSDRSTPSSIQWVVDCDNGFRARVAEPEMIPYSSK